MARLPWHRRDSEEMLALMRQLAGEEFGFISAFIDLFCARGGDVPDDDKFVAGNFSKDPRIWRRLKSRFVELGLIEVRHGRLYNGIAEREWHEGLKRIQDAARGGRASAAARGRSLQPTCAGDAADVGDTYGDKSSCNSRESNDLTVTPVQRPFEQYTDTEGEREARAKRQGLAISIGDQLRASKNPSVQASARAARQEQD